MELRAEAYQQYTQAAMLDKLLTGLPEMARALSESLANVDKITIVSTGDGRGGGVSNLTGEIAKMVAQVPEIFESLTGMKVSEIMSRLQGIEQSEPPTRNGHLKATPAIVQDDESNSSETS